MNRPFFSRYHPRYLSTIVYMAQSSEYRVTEYRRWLGRTSDFSTVIYRRQLEPTNAARLLLLCIWLGVAVELIGGVLLVYNGIISASLLMLVLGIAMVIAYPFVSGYAIMLPMWLGERLVVSPRRASRIKAAEKIFAKHPADKIAILGSYGKTSMKELLFSVLSPALNVAATPGNKNVAVSHAAFAEGLSGDEDVIIIEYGEGAPGDIADFAIITHPTRAVVTGLAPAHLDQYKTLQAAGEDIFSIGRFIASDKLYVNTDSPALMSYIQDGYQRYNHNGALGWKVEAVKIAITGISFSLRRGKEVIKLKSGLIGRHQVGPLSLTATLGIEYGIPKAQIVDAIAHTVPHEHRMQPYQLGGAWVIDDTYNGNIEGIRAGTALLSELTAARKIYVTPGLVEQGSETEAVHNEMGLLIAAAQPDIVVLMYNSVTEYIQQGLYKANYRGGLKIVDDPLNFYTNLEQFVASGDLVMMQNDWPDNYA